MVARFGSGWMTVFALEVWKRVVHLVVYAVLGCKAKDQVVVNPVVYKHAAFVVVHDGGRHGFWHGIGLQLVMFAAHCRLDGRWAGICSDLRWLSGLNELHNVHNRPVCIL